MTRLASRRGSWGRVVPLLLVVAGACQPSLPDPGTGAGGDSSSAGLAPTTGDDPAQASTPTGGEPTTNLGGAETAEPITAGDEAPPPPVDPGAQPGDPAALTYLDADDVADVLAQAPGVQDFLLANPAAEDALRENVAAALASFEGRLRVFFYGLGTAVSFPGPAVSQMRGRYVYRTADGVRHDVAGAYQAAGIGIGFQFQHVVFLGFIVDREGSAPTLDVADLDDATFGGIAAHMKECPPWLAGSVEQYQSSALPLDLYVGTTGCGPAGPVGFYCQQVTLDLTP